MKKTLVSIIIISVISFFTALLFIKIFKDVKSPKPNLEHSIIKDDYIKNRDSIIEKMDSIIDSKDSIIKSAKNLKIRDSSTIKTDEEILYHVLRAQNYLDTDNDKSLHILDFHYSRLAKLYKIKGLSIETNKLLRNTINRINIEKQKASNKMQKPISVEPIVQDSIPKPDTSLKQE